MTRYGRPKKGKSGSKGPVGAKSERAFVSARAQLPAKGRPMSVEQATAVYILYENGTCNYRDPGTKLLCGNEAAATKRRGVRRCYGHLAL